MLTGTGAGRGEDRGRRARGDGGFSLVELSIAMLIFSVLLVVFIVALRTMTTAMDRVRAVEQATTQARTAVNQISRQLTFATAVNTPVTVNGAVYLEAESGVVAGGRDPQCTQWRYLPAAGLLEVRSWSTVTGRATGWSPLIRSMVNAADQPPFTVFPAGSGFTVTRVGVDLRVRSAAGPLVQNQVQYTLRNSAEAPAPSPTTVCTENGRP